LKTTTFSRNSTVENPRVKGEGSPWGNFEKLGKISASGASSSGGKFCERSEQSWGNFLRAKRVIVGKFL